MKEIRPGMTGESTEGVTEENMASRWGSGLVSAYATPAMVALMEKASAAVIAPTLDAGQTSVGVGVNIQHLAATPVGMHVRARAEVIAVNGRRITFKVEAWDEKEKIGEGTHERAVIDAARFAERLAKKVDSGQGSKDG